MATENQAFKQEPMNFGYPSHQVPPEKKDKKWCLQYMKAFNREYTTGNSQILRWAYQQYQEWRMYARGKQPIDQYKDLLGTRKRHGKKDMSWRNLDWNILAVFPRFKKVIKNRLKKIPREIVISAIDQTSAKEIEDQRATITEWLVNRDFHESVAKNVHGYKPQVPFEKGQPTPENTDQIKMYQDMYPKNKYVMYMQDQVDMAFLQSDWKQLEDQILDDLIEVGIASTKIFIDQIGRIRIRRRIPEQTICNSCINNDFSDLNRIGDYRQVTLSELRASVPAGTFTDEDLAKIASKTSGRDYTAIGAQSYFLTWNRYPWDHEKVTILDAEWYSADDIAYVKTKNSKGNTTFQKRDNPQWLNKKGLTDAEYQTFYATKGEERTIIRDTVNNVYGAEWICDTDYIFNYGRKSNMIRAVGSINDCMLSSTMYTMDFDSIMRQCEPLLDNIQVNWLQYQHHIAKSKPDGLAIERRALGMVEIGNKKFKMQDLLQMYAETGSFVYVGTDPNGRPYPYKPLENIKGGISEAAVQHLDFIIRDIDIMRGIIGLNEVTDSSLPPTKTGKFVAETAVANSDNALGDMYHGFINIYENTARRVALLVPDAEMMGRSKGKELALGSDSHAFFIDTKRLALMDLAISIDAGITEEMRANLHDYVVASLKTNGGVLLPEDAFLIENEKNIWRAYQLLAQKRRQREAELQQMEIEKMNAQAQGNTQTAVALEQEKQKSMFLDLQSYKEKKNIDTESEIAVIREKGVIDMMLAKLTKGMELTAEENQTYLALLQTEMKVKGDLTKANILAQSKKEGSKVQVRA